MKINFARWSLLLVLVFCGTVLNQPPIQAQATLSAIEPINSGETVEGSIPASTIANDCLLGATQYKIEIVASDRKALIGLIGNQNTDLYVRRGIPVAIEDGKILADFKSVFLGLTDHINLPSFGGAPIQPGTYFIAITNCAQVAANYKLIATISGPPDAERVNLSASNLIVGSIPAPVPGNCGISRTQYTVSEGFSNCGGGIFWDVLINADQNVNVLIRKDRPVTVENGVFMYDRMSENQVKVHSLSNFQETPGGGTFFIAVLNCGYEPVNYTVTSGAIIADVFPPIITTAFFKKKDLHIGGQFLSRGTVTIDNQPQTAIEHRFDPVLGEVLIIKQAKKHIAHRQTVRIVVTRFDGCDSGQFLFTRH